MQTTATNRKLSVIFQSLQNGALEIHPEFQRRLVWTEKHKNALIRTVLEKYPFPEIYIATENINVETGASKEIIVDGQQRISTLFQYFTASPDLILELDVPPYSTLTNEQKKDFLDYEVVIRDLKNASSATIKEVFKRINSTSYSLNGMEINNAIYDGEFKHLCEKLSELSFFEINKIFSTNEIKRMKDVEYCVTLVATAMGGYYSNNKNNDDYLKTYNENFIRSDELYVEFKNIFQFIEKLKLEKTRFSQKADLFTLIIELLNSNLDMIDLNKLSNNLKTFYNEVDSFVIDESCDFSSQIYEYKNAVVQGTNNRSNRITRGEIIKNIIDSSKKDD